MGDTKGTLSGCIGVMLVAFVLAAVTAPLGGWSLMLLLGVLYHEFSASIPPVGYWPCVAVVALSYSVASAVLPYRRQAVSS